MGLSVLRTDFAVNDDNLFITRYAANQVLVLVKPTLFLAQTIFVPGSPGSISIYGADAYVAVQGTTPDRRHEDWTPWVAPE